MHAARSSPSSAGERSVETLIVVAPSSSSDARGRGVRAGEENRRLEDERRRVARRRAACRRAPSSTPRSATRNERMPSATPRRTSATDASIPACPRATPPAARRDERLPARVPGAARPEEERDLDSGFGAERGHLADLARRSASSRRCPARPAARARLAARPPRARPRARAGPRPTGSRCGSGGRRRSGRRSSRETLRPEGLEGVGIAGKREHVRSPDRPRCAKSSTCSSSSVRPLRAPRAR